MKAWRRQLRKLSTTLAHSPKGQLLSKGLFCDINSSKKRTKKFCLSRQGQKLKFSSSFPGRIEDTKRHFAIN